MTSEPIIYSCCLFQDLAMKENEKYRVAKINDNIKFCHLPQFLLVKWIRVTSE